MSDPFYAERAKERLRHAETCQSETCKVKFLPSDIRLLLDSHDRLTRERNKLLEGLENLGWPCRLEELPDYVAHLTRELREAKRELELRCAICTRLDCEGTHESTTASMICALRDDVRKAEAEVADLRAKLAEEPTKQVSEEK